MSNYEMHSPIRVGKLNGIEVALVSRHGLRYEFSPSKVPYRSNIYALKNLGCKAIIATSACGSLKDEVGIGTFSFPSQFIDRTTKREESFSATGKVLHELMNEPFSKELRVILENKCRELNFPFTTQTTIITIEGPRFSSRAESKLYKSWGADLINMTTVPEVCLAKEVKIPYQVINLVTNYDCWHESKSPASYEEIVKVMQENSAKVKQLIFSSLPVIEETFK